MAPQQSDTSGLSGDQLVYESSNGDAWFLSLDPTTGRPAVKHVPNLSSGGRPSYSTIESFLAIGNGPEHQALRRLVQAERLFTMLIAYDVHAPNGTAYQELADAIQSLGAWWHHLETVWMVRSNQTPDEIRDHLRAHVGADDQLLVLDITDDRAAWAGVNDAGSRWLDDHVGAEVGRRA